MFEPFIDYIENGIPKRKVLSAQKTLQDAASARRIFIDRNFEITPSSINSVLKTKSKTEAIEHLKLENHPSAFGY